MCKKLVRLFNWGYTINGKENETENEKSSRYDINRPGRWHGHKKTKYKICHDIMMVISIRKRQSFIWNLIHKKVKQQRLI